MNRIALTFDEHGDFVRICADDPVMILWVSPHSSSDPVYLYSSAEIGSRFVEKEIAGYTISHYGDGGAASGSRKPQRGSTRRRPGKTVSRPDE